MTRSVALPSRLEVFALAVASLTMRKDPLKSASSRWKRLAQRLLPPRVQEHLRELRELSAAERRAHLGMTLRRFTAARAPIPPEVGGSGTILFVCHGNIIRSALAGALARHHSGTLANDFPRVTSAGLAARPGREADARAVAAGRALGVDLSAHRAQALTRELVDEAAVIFVMDRLNEAQLLARFPDATRKLRRLGALAVMGDDDVIADPYVLDADAVSAVAVRIDRAVRALVEELARRANQAPTGRP